MRIDMMASEPHFADHLAAVWHALPEESRGTFMARGAPAQRAAVAASVGMEPVVSSPDRPVLVAAYGDLARARRENRTRVAIMEHGAGQSYHGVARSMAAVSSSYAGGPSRFADLFLHPGPDPASRDRARYPRARVEIVGAPILDTLPAMERHAGEVVAVTFHFDTGIVPETRAALPHFRRALAQLARDRQVIGHAHPRWHGKLDAWYRSNGIEPVATFAEVCRRADVLIADNTSALFAFAATGRPVVVLNPPWYRRHVQHGLRFWDAADVGVNVASPANLGAAVAEALEDAPSRSRAREAALSLVYAHRAGAAARAAEALLDWASETAIARVPAATPDYHPVTLRARPVEPAIPAELEAGRMPAPGIVQTV